MDRKHDTRAYFDEVGEKYGSFYQQGSNLAVYPSGPMREQKALRLVRQFKPSGNVLDAGCGTGHFACELARVGYTVRGIDLSEQMIHQAQDHWRQHGQHGQHGPRANALGSASFSVGDVESLQFDDRSLDAVTSLGVIEYLDRDDTALAEAGRVLKEDGVLVMAFRNRLFNLFSLNRYTQEEIDSGQIAQLLAEYQAEVAQSGNAWPAAELARQFAQHAAAAADECGSAQTPTAPIPRPVPLPLRQHTPAQARQSAARHGFQFRAMLYFHFHPFPPMFEKPDAQTFNRLGLAMETLDQTPIGALMASAFVAAFTRS